MKSRTIYLKLLALAIISFCYVSSFAQVNFQTNLQLNTNKLPFACPGDTFQLITPIVMEKGNFIWFRNEQQIEFSQNNTLTTTEPGVYKVICTDDSLTFESNTFEIFPCNKDPKDFNPDVISVSVPVITSNDNVICGSYTQAHLTCSVQNAGYTYKWYYSTSYSGSYTLISGANTFTYTATQAGYYKVNVDDGATAPETSYPFQVYSSPLVKLTDTNGNLYPTINTTAGANVTLKVSFIGTSLPVTFSVKNGANTQTFVATTNPYTFNVSTNVNAAIYVNNFYPDCGNGNYNSNGTAYLIIDNSTNFSLSNSSMNVCAGQTLSIPYTTTGTWGNARSFYIYLYDPTTSTYIKGWDGQTTSPLMIDLPSNLTLNNTYTVYVHANLPYLTSNDKSFTITPTSNNCTPSAFISMYPANQACSSVSLYANPRVSGYIYKWYKNDVAFLEGSDLYYYSATSSGNYKVKVTNPATGANSTSSNYAITIDFVKPVITASSQSICSNPNGVTLTSSITNNSYTYQWYYTPNGGSSKPISNATSSTYTAFTEGYYRLMVSNSSCSVQSDNFYLSDNGYVVATNTTDEFNYITINSGASTTIKLTLSGVSPYTITYYDGIINRTIVTNNSTYNLTVSPAYNTRYNFWVSSNCGNSNSNSFTVYVNSSTALSLPTPTNTTVCSGAFFDIPFTTSGTWPSEKVFNVSLVDNNGNSISNSYKSSLSTTANTIPYFVDALIPTGTYRVKVGSSIPYLNSSVTSTYTITITNSGCTLPNAKIIPNFTNSCVYPQLSAYPTSNNYSYTYKWYLNGTLQTTTSYSYYYPSQNGNYYVVITNNNGYNSTSNTINVNVNLNNVNYNNSGYCSSGQTMTPFNTQNGNTYDWYFSTGGLAYNKLNITTSTHTVSSIGNYMVIIKNGNCEAKQSFYCYLYLKVTNQAVCLGSTIKINYNNYYSSNQLIKFQLLNASTNAIVVDNLITTTLNSGSNSLSVVLPNSVPAGTYKIKAFAVNNTSISNTSDAIITVKNGTASPPLTITANPTSISSPTSVAISASACTGNYIWNNGYSGQTINYYLNNGYEFKVQCKALNGCLSPESSLIVLYTCTDAYEPNDLSTTASVIHGDSFTSTPICLGYNTDKDWFSFIINGRKYFALVKYYRNGTNSNTPKQFYFKKELVGDELTLQTYAVNNGEYYDTELYLYNESLSQIAYDDESNGNNFSKIIYNITNNCQSNVELLTSEYDIYPNETSLIKSTNYIKANTKIMNTAKASFEAQNYILLQPGFETMISTGGYFKAEIKGCN